MQLTWIGEFPSMDCSMIILSIAIRSPQAQPLSEASPVECSWAPSLVLKASLFFCTPWGLLSWESLQWCHLSNPTELYFPRRIWCLSWGLQLVFHPALTSSQCLNGLPNFHLGVEGVWGVCVWEEWGLQFISSRFGVGRVWWAAL